MLFFFPCIDILRTVLQLLNVVLNICIVINYIVAPHLKHKSSLIVFFVSFCFLPLKSIMLETPDKAFAILEIKLVSIKETGSKK